MMLPKPKFHRLAQDVVDQLARESITCTPDEILWLQEMAGEVVKSSDPARFMDLPTPCGNVLLWPLLPNAHAWLFPIDDTVSMAREVIIKLGMLFFLFVAGLEVDLARFQRKGLTIALTSILGIVVPFGLGFGSVLVLPSIWGSLAQEKELILALFIGTALSISALPVIARILIDLDLIRTELGSIIITTATINDLIGWSLFAVILGTILPGSPHRDMWGTLCLIVGILVFFLWIGRYLVVYIMRWVQRVLDWPSGFIGVVAILVLIAAASVESLGIHPVFGAFLVGVIIGQKFEHRKNNHAHEVIYQFAISFFAPLYFVSVGLKVNFAENLDLLLVLLVIVIASIGKIIGAGLGAWLSGLTLKKALTIGYGLNARGAMEIILASVAFEYKVIDERIFVALVIMGDVPSIVKIG